MLHTTIGNLYIEGCIGNASGPRCTSIEELDELVNTLSCSLVVTKSSTIEPRIGNEEPRYGVIKEGTINSMGIPNFGYKYYQNYINNNTSSKPIFHSIIPFSNDDLTMMLLDLGNNCKTDSYFVEINLSCPNIVGKSIIAYDFTKLEMYLENIHDIISNGINDNNIMFDEFMTVGIKLPPYYLLEDFITVSKIINKYNTIKFVTCINSVINGLDVDIDTEHTIIKPKDGLGGIGGLYCLPTALANVRQFSQLLNVDVIGCGGVSTGSDVFKHILCGAAFVQIGSTFMIEGTSCFNRIQNELIEIMEKKGYTKLSDFRGKLKT